MWSATQTVFKMWSTMLQSYNCHDESFTQAWRDPEEMLLISPGLALLLRVQWFSPEGLTKPAASSPRCPAPEWPQPVSAPHTSPSAGCRPSGGDGSSQRRTGSAGRGVPAWLLGLRFWPEWASLRSMNSNNERERKKIKTPEEISKEDPYNFSNKYPSLNTLVRPQQRPDLS